MLRIRDLYSITIADALGGESIKQIFNGRRDFLLFFFLILHGARMRVGKAERCWQICRGEVRLWWWGGGKL